MQKLIVKNKDLIKFAGICNRMGVHTTGISMTRIPPIHEKKVEDFYKRVDQLVIDWKKQWNIE